MNLFTRFIIASLLGLIPGWLSAGCPATNLNGQIQVEEFARQHASCTTIEGDLILSGDIHDVSGLAFLEEIEGDLRIVQSELATLYAAFPSLHTIGGNLLILDNQSLGSIRESFASLSSIDGSLVVSGHNALFEVGAFSHLKSIGGRLEFKDNHLLARIPDFAYLESVDEILIDHCGLLQMVTGFSALSQIEGSLSIQYNPVLREVSGFPALEQIPGTLLLAQNQVLERLIGFDQLFALGYLHIEDHPALVRIPSFDQLTSIQSISILHNESLPVLEGFSRLTEVQGDVDLYSNSSLQYINAFGALRSILGSFYIVNNDGLLAIQGFNLLEQIGDHLDISDNNQLFRIQGFSRLQTISGSFYLEDNGRLEEVYGFGSLRQIGEDFALSNNQIRILPAFGYLQQVGGDFQVYREPLLSQLNAFGTLAGIGGFLHIESNDQLKVVAGFGNLVHIGVDLYIRSNALLSTISGFSKLRTVGNDIWIRNNPVLTSIGGFGQLQQVGDDLRIIDHVRLEAITAFETLTSVTDDLEVRNNPALRFCCGLGTLIDVVGYGTANISANAEGCNSVAEIDAACNATLSDCTPNCIGYVNAAIDLHGTANLQPSDFVSDTSSCADGVEVTIEDNIGRIVYGPRIVGINALIPLDACRLLNRQPLKITTRGGGGACWSELTFKDTQAPTIQQDTMITVLCGDPLTEGPLPGMQKLAWVPCQEEIVADWITDWVQTFECDPGVQDTVKIIYREWEAFDKTGKRAASFDTIVVLQLPEILPENIYCEDKDTVFCADTTTQIGPYITYNDPLLGCQETYLVAAGDRDGDGSLEFYPKHFDPKCGISVHVDYRKFPGECETQYRVTVDIKQHCYGPGSLSCMVPVSAGMPPNMATQLGDGYWRCEFWVLDLDTLAPELICKGDPLFDAAFPVDQFQFLDGFLSSTVSPMTRNQLIQPDYSYFDLKAIPYHVKVRSLEQPIFDIRESEEREIAPNFFFPANYSANAAMVYQADEHGVFSFSWDFDLGSPDPLGGREAALAVDHVAVASVFFAVNGQAYRLVQGDSVPEMIEDLNLNRLRADQSLITSPDMIMPVGVNESQYGKVRIPLTPGDQLYIIAVWDSRQNATLRISGLNEVSTSQHDCVAHTYLPRLQARDDWSGVKQAKVSIPSIGTFQLQYDVAQDCWVSHDHVPLPYQEDPYKMIYEVYDECHNVGFDSCYIYVKDRVKPVPVVDKGFTVSLGEKKVWLDASSFDEGTEDNCGLQYFLIRRADWLESCINLCDSLRPLCITEHHDTLWNPVLELDKHVDDVEAHYAQTMAWLKYEGGQCGQLLYNAWLYDLSRYTTLHCNDGAYPLSEAGFDAILDSCAYDLKHAFQPLAFDQQRGLYQSGLAPELINTYQQLGGGWSTQVPVSCEDACGPVTIEILAMDYWCNWTKAWTTVWVEDKVPPRIVHDVLAETEITCAAYKSNHIVLPGEKHTLSVADLVDRAKEGDSLALAGLDQVFGGYVKAWKDPYGNYVDVDGNIIEKEINFIDQICTCTTATEEVKVYDPHLGTYWKDSIITQCFHVADTIPFKHGVIESNCAGKIHCSQEIWCELDHCGEGYIQRKFKIWQGCEDDFYASDLVPDSLKHPVDTLYRTQRIWIGNRCELNKYMFDVPADTTLYTCGIIYDEQGNVGGDLHPDALGPATYKFDDDCRLVGIAHQDRAYKIIGGESSICYKIARTWYFADWCTYGESTRKHWWRDYELVLDSCVQYIYVSDTTAPQCIIQGPVPSGDTLEIGSCTYTLNLVLEADDKCSTGAFDWRLSRRQGNNNQLLRSGSDDLKGTSETQLVLEGLEPGSYKVWIEVEDGCKNKDTCSYEVTLVPVKKPTPICITSLTARLIPWDLDHDGIADTAHTVIWAEEFDRSSIAACGDTAVEFRLDLLDDQGDNTYLDDADSLLLGCQHVGARVVRLWVISLPSGTVDYCDVVLVTQSDFAGCDDPSGEENQVIADQYHGEGEVRIPVKKFAGQQRQLIPQKGMDLPSRVSESLLMQNQPNPFRNETAIWYQLPEDGQVYFRFFDLTGRLLYEKTMWAATGWNTVKVHREQINAQGVIFYQLNFGSQTMTKSMVLLP